MGGSLVIQTSFLGDVILTTPLIAELAQRGPVDVLVTPVGAAALENNPDIRTVIRYDKRGTYGSSTYATVCPEGISDGFSMSFIVPSVR